MRSQAATLGVWTSLVFTTALVPATALLAATALVPATALAGDGYGDPKPRRAGGGAPQGKSMLSAEGLFGYGSTSVVDEVDSSTLTTTISAFSFAGGGVAVAYLVPRLAYDYIAQSGFTIGVAAGLSNTGGEVELDGDYGSETRAAPNTTTAYLQPRLGVMLGSDRFGVHLRSGVAYRSTSIGRGGGDDSSWAIPFEAGLFLFGRDAAWAMSLTPAYYWGFSGQATVDGDKLDSYTISSTALSFGLHILL